MCFQLIKPGLLLLQMTFLRALQLQADVVKKVYTCSKVFIGETWRSM